MYLISDGGLKSSNDQIQLLPVTSGVALKIGSKFSVNADGTMRASGASFSGAISGSTITGGSININNKFKVSSNGTMTATSGNIGGWSIYLNELRSGLMSLRAFGAPYIDVAGFGGSILRGTSVGAARKILIYADRIEITDYSGHGYRYGINGPQQI